MISPSILIFESENLTGPLWKGLRWKCNGVQNIFFRFALLKHESDFVNGLSAFEIGADLLRPVPEWKEPLEIYSSSGRALKK